MFYTVKAPWLIRKLYPTFTWEKPATEKIIYLTFDDGPHPVATPFVLDQLRQYDAKATFFCIGKNVVEHPGIYRRILDEGHRVGNHTFKHLNGWKTGNQQYFEDIYAASKFIDSNLFRPPYGRITRFQAKLLQQQKEGRPPFSIIMWSVLSGDFDVQLTPEACLKNVVLSIKPGSIVVFHDSAKAWERLEYALPRVLQHCSKSGYRFASIS